MESVKKFLEKEGEMAITMDGLPQKFFEPFTMKGIKVDLLELGRIVCSFEVPLVDLIGSAAILTIGTPSFGVSVEINVSYLDFAYPGEEVEVEARALRVGKAVGVASVELRKKKTCKIIAFN
ncbi:hypothetical protein L3X38_029046 [Prunus dulcis]|uniref:Thioesterase domain-containing protein n=1 Tax=Prunus dulcis TaxID=3755 RepID=A0AAD4Z220_PRUDU|nr:hypothetical protein L3X38_029046 [Prunus dulcis]